MVVFFKFLKLYKWYQSAQRITFYKCECFLMSILKYKRKKKYAKIAKKI